MIPLDKIQNHNVHHRYHQCQGQRVLSKYRTALTHKKKNVINHTQPCQKTSAFLPTHSKELHSAILNTHRGKSTGHFKLWYSWFINHGAIGCIGQIVCFLFIQIMQSAIKSIFTTEYILQWRVWRREEMWTLETQHRTHQRIVLGEL